MLPIICFTCGELLSDKQLELEKCLEENETNINSDKQKLLQKLDYCCKMRLISHLPVVKNKKPNSKKDEN